MMGRELERREGGSPGSEGDDRAVSDMTREEGVRETDMIRVERVGEAEEVGGGPELDRETEIQAFLGLFYNDCHEERSIILSIEK